MVLWFAPWEVLCWSAWGFEIELVWARAGYILLERLVEATRLRKICLTSAFAEEALEEQEQEQEELEGPWAALLHCQFEPDVRQLRGLLVPFLDKAAGQQRMFSTCLRV